MIIQKPMAKGERRKILSELDKKYEEDRRAQAPLRKKWTKLEAYVAGYQYRDPNGRYRGHEYTQAPGESKNIDDEGLIINEVLRVHLSNMQRLAAYQIQPKVIPTNRSNENKVAARLGTTYLADVIRRQDEEKLKQKIARLLSVYGVFFLKPSFDPTIGDMIDKPVRGAFGRMKAWLTGKEQIPEGDFAIDVKGPRNILLPRFTRDISKADGFTDASIVTCDHAFRRYGVVVAPETIRPDESEMMGEGYLNEGESQAGTEEGNTTDRVVLKEKFLRPSPRYPRGAIFAWANGTLLRSTELLKWYPGLPLFSGEMIYDDRTAYADSLLWSLLPSQDMLNKTCSAMYRYAEMLALLKRWIKAGSNVDEKALSNATAKNATYEGDKPPEWDRPPELHQSIFAMQGNFRDLMASHGFSNELAKQKRAISGNAIGALQEIDDTVMRPALKSIESALKGVSQFILKCTPQYITVDRQIKQAGAQGWQVETFNGAMLKGNFHAEVNLMTGIPTNKILRLEFLKGLYKDGLMKDYEVRSHMEFGTDEQALEELQKENEVADGIVQTLENFPDDYSELWDVRDNRKIYASNVVGREFDNHTLIQAKLELAMREGFPHWNRWVQDAFLKNWRYHKGMAAQEAAAQAALAAPPQGGPKGGGAPAFPGPQEPWSLSTKDSFQSADQQPDPGMVPPAMSSGFQNH